MLKTVIAIDFDGTVVTEAYPGIGDEIAGAIESIKSLQENESVECVLWTCRGGRQLEEAVSWLEERGVFLNYINENTTEQMEHWDSNPRKIAASIYIDDRTIGGFKGWNYVMSEIEKYLSSAQPGS